MLVFIVRNVTDSEKTAEAVINDFTAREDESGSPQVIIGDSELPTSIQPFVQSVPEVTLGPGEEREIPVTLSIPESTAPGSYYGVLRFVDSTVDSQSDNSNVALSASVGSIFLVTVPGETVDLLSLEEIFISNGDDRGRFFSTAPNTVNIRINNQGNTFQAPYGRVLVKDWNDNIVYQYEFNDANPPGNVLPDSIRLFSEEIENIGNFGRYTVEANLSYGDGGGNLITASTVFWVLPWTTILTVLVGVVALAYAGTRGIKRYNQSVIRKSKGEKVKKK